MTWNILILFFPCSSFVESRLQEVRAEAATRLSSSEVAREREERDTVIQELREEGEKLSKQQLNYSNIIKKLRAKEKESETTIKTQKWVVVIVVFFLFF